MAGKKKDISNVSNMFFSSEEPQEQPKEQPIRPKKELRTRRTQLLFKPSTFAALQQIALEDDTSINDIVNTLCEDFITKRSKKK